MKHLIILFSLLCLYACSSSSCDEQEFNLIGTWELFEYCNSPGDISCPIQTPNNQEIERWELSIDSSFTFFLGGRLMNSGTFSVTNSIIIFVNDADGELITQRFIIAQGPCEVDLNGLCIEECRRSYEKVD